MLVLFKMCFDLVGGRGDSSLVSSLLGRFSNSLDSLIILLILYSVVNISLVLSKLKE